MQRHTIPTFNEKGGHPIAITFQDWEDKMGAEPDNSLRGIISSGRLNG